MTTTDMLKIASRHWPEVAGFAAPIESERQYRRTVEFLDAILDAGAADESHPLASLAGVLGERIGDYEDRKYPPPGLTAVDLIRELMVQHGLKQSELPEIGPQSVVSFVLNGRRKLNGDQIIRLAKRFNLPVESFLEE